MSLVWEDVDFVSPATFPPGSWVDEFEMLHVFFSQEYLSTSGICSWVRGLSCYVLFFPESPATREWPWLHCPVPLQYNSHLFHIWSAKIVIVWSNFMEGPVEQSSTGEAVTWFFRSTTLPRESCQILAMVRDSIDFTEHFMVIFCVTGSLKKTWPRRTWRE